MMFEFFSFLDFAHFSSFIAGNTGFDFASIFAYLDPGTGSLIIQAVIGAVAGVTVFGRNTIRTTGDRVKQVFSKGSRDTRSASKGAITTGTTKSRDDDSQTSGTRKDAQSDPKSSPITEDPSDPKAK